MATGKWLLVNVKWQLTNNILPITMANGKWQKVKLMGNDIMWYMVNGKY